jgi:hypothetical protein
MPSISTSLENQPQRVKVPKPGRLKFGSSPMGGFLPMLERQPLAELVFKDIAAFNAPKIALCRTWKERWDTATLELSNTGITLFSSLFLPKLLRKPVEGLSKISTKTLGREIPFAELAKTSNAEKMARMGVSFGFFFPFAAAFWAAPFFRNWLTLKRTQSANFESIIGFDGVKSNKPQRSVQEEMSYQKRSALKVFAIGAALGAASLVSFGYAAKVLGGHAKGKFVPTLKKRLETFLERKGSRQWNWFFNHFDLKGKSANQIEGVPAQLIFWGLPAYLGWVHGARSNNERRERVLQSANALFWFFAAPKLSNALWDGRFLKVAGKPEYWSTKFTNDIKANLHGETFQTAFINKVKNLKFDDIEHFQRVGQGFDKAKLIQLKNLKFAISGLAVPIGALALVQLLNFRLTERKLKGKIAESNSTPIRPNPSLPLKSSWPQSTGYYQTPVHYSTFPANHFYYPQGYAYSGGSHNQQNSSRSGYYSR